MDLEGRTVIPGLIDMHAHHHQEYETIQPPHDFETAIYLAYGVTTTFDPTTSSLGVFPTAELIEAGGMIGPRVFVLGRVHHSPRERVDQRDTPRPMKPSTTPHAAWQWGAVGLKDYMQATRYQRQWVVEAGRRLGVMVTSEGSLDIDHKIGTGLGRPHGLRTFRPGIRRCTPIPPPYSAGSVSGVLGHSGDRVDRRMGRRTFFGSKAISGRDAKLQRWMPWRQLIPMPAGACRDRRPTIPFQ